ncbi:hypothetical protein ACTNDY_00450 [Tissierellaceae bacterium HCP3S3_D8]
MKDLQDIFNEIYGFLNLKEKAQKYISEIVFDFENNFLGEVFKEPQEIYELKNFMIEYSKTCLIINKCFEENPSFRIVFDFIDPNNGYPRYSYEVEYNILGEFLDEFFYEV